MMWHLLRRNRLLTSSVILTLGMGVGVAAAMCNLIDVLLFKPPAHVIAPGRLVRVPFATNYVRYQHLENQLRSADLAAYTRTTLTTGFGRDALPLRAECVTDNYFQVLGTKLVVGRPFQTQDAPGTGGRDYQVAIISYGLWKRLFPEGTDVAGMHVPISGRRYQVIGIAPRDFSGVDPEPVDVWLSLTQTPDLCAFTGRSLLGSESGAWLRTIGRIHDSSTLADAEAELGSFSRQSGNTDSTFVSASPPRIQPLSASRQARLSRESRVALWSAGAALVVLLIACANVAVFMTLRSMDRRLEVAVRIQLGATPARVFLLFLLENLLLTGLCIASAAVVAVWMNAGLRGFFPAITQTGLDVRSTGIVAGFGLFAGLVSTVIPALQVAHANPSTALRSGPQVVGGRSRARSLLLVVQLGLAQLLLIAAAMFVRSVDKLTTEAGYDLEHVIVATVELERQGYVPVDTWRIIDEAAQQIRQLPPVTHIGISSATLLGSGGMTVGVGIRTGATADKSSMITMNAVSPDYFAALGTRILRGRPFSVDDTRGATLVGIVDQGLANAHWPGENPIGKCVFLADYDACIEVVGVSETRRPAHLTMSREEFFVPSTQAGAYHALHQVPRTLFVRVNKPVRDVIPAVVSVLQNVAPEVPAGSVRSLLTLADEQTRSWRLGARTFHLYWVIAAMMAAAGLYGALALMVRQRTAEIAVRMVLGATPITVIRIVIRSAFLLLAAGCVLGSVLALAMGSLIEDLLFDVAPTDPGILLPVTLLICAVGFAGCLLPVVRAARLNPANALRQG